MRQHRAGKASGGSPLLSAATQAGIAWEMVLELPGTRADERRMKRNRFATRHCPRCGSRRRAPEVPA